MVADAREEGAPVYSGMSLCSWRTTGHERRHGAIALDDASSPTTFCRNHNAAVHDERGLPLRATPLPARYYDTQNGSSKRRWERVC